MKQLVACNCCAVWPRQGPIFAEQLTTGTSLTLPSIIIIITAHYCPPYVRQAPSSSPPLNAHPVSAKQAAVVVSAGAAGPPSPGVLGKIRKKLSSAAEALLQETWGGPGGDEAQVEGKGALRWGVLAVRSCVCA